MAKSSINPKLDFYFEKGKKWNEEMEILRAIILGCGLTEELKWGNPCYTVDKKNVVLIHSFKEYCAMLFFKGSLMKDPEKILIQQTENVQAARQIRFTNDKEILKLKPELKKYILQAVELEKTGAKVPLKKATEFKMADEFRTVIDKKAAVKKAFYELTPGRQRAYLLHFAAPKQSATRTARVEKAIPQMLKGKGLNDD